MGLLDQLQAYIKANTPRATRPVAKPSQVINEGLLNPNKFNAPAANRFKDSAFGLLGVVPGVGDAASAAESADLFNRGENFAGSMAALGALPFIPAVAGMVKRPVNALGDAIPPTVYEQAHEEARKNAVKMLGLPENNTAMDRARAMGFDVDAYHGSAGKDFDKFNTAMSGQTTKAKNTTGTVFAAKTPNTASNYIEPSFALMEEHGLVPKNLDPHNINMADVWSFRNNPDYDWLLEKHLKEVDSVFKNVSDDIGDKSFLGGKFFKTDRAGELKDKYGDFKFDVVDHMPEYSRVENSEISKIASNEKQRLLKNQSIEMAYELGGEPRIMPLKIKTSGMNVHDFKGAKRVHGDFANAMTGEDGSVLKNTYDGGGLDTIYAVKDPSRIRSRFAAFDPARSDSSDLLAGLAPYLGIGGLLSAGGYRAMLLDDHEQ